MNTLTAEQLTTAVKTTGVHVNPHFAPGVKPDSDLANTLRKSILENAWRCDDPKQDIKLADVF